MLNLFSVPVYKDNVKGTSEEILNTFNLLDSIWKDCDREVWAGETGKSTGQKDLFLHERTEMNWIINAMYPHVLKYWDQNLKYNPTKILPVSSWANLHEDGDNTNEHSHSDGMNQAHVASVFYLEKEQGGDIEFCNPLDYIHRLTPRAIGLGDKILSETVACSTGDFLLFPGWLRHRTTPANGRRIAISINFNGMFQ
tara:strand:+ start:171 stop:761 length:591 start_codon:yes stop_codon:yes gene_type:complete